MGIHGYFMSEDSFSLAIFLKPSSTKVKLSTPSIVIFNMQYMQLAYLQDIGLPIFGHAQGLTSGKCPVDVVSTASEVPKVKSRPA